MKQEIQKAIERWEGHYSTAQTPEKKKEYWQHLCHLRNKLREVDPNTFRKAKLRAV